MDYMFVPGFLGTKAPFFMDFVTLIVAFLPLLLAIAIFFAKKRMYTAHMVFQVLLFLFSFVIIGYFEYGVRIDGGFEKFVHFSSISEKFLYGFLIFHIAVSAATTVWWTKTICCGLRDFSRDVLPGRASAKHLRDGRISAAGIFLTSFTGVWVYLFLFIF